MVAELANVAPDGSGQQVGYIPIERIRNTTPQVRRDWRHDEGQQKLDELTQSIRNYGLLTPIEVTRGDDGYFQVLVGHRRFVAGKRAGLTHIACIVREANERERTVLQLAENIHRQELSAVDEADAYAQLLQERGSTVAQLARTLAVSERRIATWLRMGARTALREAVAAGLIAPQTAAALGELDDEAAAPLYARLRQGERIGPCDVAEARRTWRDAKVPELHRQGRSIEQIAKALDLGQRTVQYRLRKAEAETAEPTPDPPNVTFNGVNLDPLIARAQHTGIAAQEDHEDQQSPTSHPRPTHSPLPWENRNAPRLVYNVDPAGLIGRSEAEAVAEPARDRARLSRPAPEPVPPIAAPSPRPASVPAIVDDADVARLRFMLHGAEQPCRDLLTAALNLGREKGWSCQDLWRKVQAATDVT